MKALVVLALAVTIIGVAYSLYSGGLLKGAVKEFHDATHKRFAALEALANKALVFAEHPDAVHARINGVEGLAKDARDVATEAYEAVRGEVVSGAELLRRIDELGKTSEAAHARMAQFVSDEVADLHSRIDQVGQAAGPTAAHVHRDAAIADVAKAGHAAVANVSPYLADLIRGARVYAQSLHGHLQAVLSGDLETTHVNVANLIEEARVVADRLAEAMSGHESLARAANPVADAFLAAPMPTRLFAGVDPH